ncbi:MAG: twin-arginine translocase TatA/TatE family subunit [Nitrososphaeraceae archaeon]
MSYGSFLLEIGGSEWLIIILLALILLFGSKKIPELSRTLGKAAGEYQKAHQMFKKEMQNANLDYSNDMGFVSPKTSGPVTSEKEKLAAIADSLGIAYSDSTTEEQLRLMISEKMQR